MGDDFDLFPKRENLDPFSFGKKEKTPETEKQEGEDDLFGQQEQAPGSPPDFPLDIPPEPVPDPPPAEPPPVPGLPLGDQGISEPPFSDGTPPVEPPSSTASPITDQLSDPLDGILSGGPISEEKTFDEPVFEPQQVADVSGEKSSRKTPSPFVVVGGALIIIIGLLYGALTYLKRDKPQVPALNTPSVGVAVVPAEPENVPVPEPEPGTSEIAVETEVPPVAETAPPGETESTQPEVQTSPVQETAPPVVKPAPKPEPAVQPSPVAATGAVQYSIQVGAFILDSSVAELEKKLRGLGYDPILKKGSTTAMMNMLTVGPFGTAEEARAALSRLKGAGVDSNMRRRDDGSAIINAGSYLLEENATSVMKKIRSLGYPVKLLKKEAKLPMTFVRVGSYAGMDDANRVKDELKDKGLEGIVVKL